MMSSTLYLPPRSEELISIVQERDLTLEELLALKSRSFAVPIHQLETARGQNEANKRKQVQLLYIWARELDTIEDSKLSKNKKFACIRDLRYIVTEIERRNPSKDDIDDLIKKDNIKEEEKSPLKRLTDELKKGVINKEEEIFVEQFGKGEPLRESYKLDYPIRKVIRDCVTTMCTGDEKFLEIGSLKNIQDIHEYCYYVAENVGLALNSILYIMDRESIRPYSARPVGRFLQETNILKNLEEDSRIENRIKFPPEDLYQGVTYEELFKSQKKSAKIARENVFTTLLRDAENNFDPAMDYVYSISIGNTGYIAFCLGPIISGQKTLEVMRKAGAECVFKGETDAIKIPPDTFLNISGFTQDIVKMNNGRNVKSWMREYRDNPDKFSFSVGEYENWSPEWLKQ